MLFAPAGLILQIVANTPSTPASPGIVQLDTVRQAYELAASRSKKPALPFEEMLSQSDFDERLNANFKYTSRIMATKEDSASGHLFINGKHVPMSGVSAGNAETRTDRLTTAMDGVCAAGADEPTPIPGRTGTSGCHAPMLMPDWARCRDRGYVPGVLRFTYDHG